MPATVSFMGDQEFQDEWFGEDEDGNSLHEVGLRGGWDAATRDKELDNDGVTGEVVFPGPDAATGTMGVPFGAGFNPQETHGPDKLLGARAYNRWAATLCQDSPERRAGYRRADPRRPRRRDRRDQACARRRTHRWDHHPPQWGDHESYTSSATTRCGHCAKTSSCRSTRTRGRGAQGLRQRAGWMSVYGYETIWFTARPLWFMLLTGVFERYPRLKMSVVEAGSFWAADLLWRTDMIAINDMARARWAPRTRPSHDAAERVLRPQLWHRFVEHPSPRAARRYEIGVGNIMWGNDFPHPEGTWPYTREFSRTVSGTSRPTRPRRSSA